MFSALLITFREGLEAAMIIGIIPAYLISDGNRDRFNLVWTGKALVVFVIFVAGAILIIPI